jgi:bifunctional non-homologous end joining protein LigD
MIARFPEVVADITPIRYDFIADGELVVLDDQGRPQWDRLHGRHAATKPDCIKRAAVENPAAIFAFDLLSLNSDDFRTRPLLQRKAALAGVLPCNKRIRYATHIANSCGDLWKFVNEMELEGIVAKDAGSIYSAGRTTRWQKIKTDIGAERERHRRP